MEFMLLLRRWAPWSIVVPVFGMGVVMLLDSVIWDRPANPVAPWIGVLIGVGLIGCAAAVLVQWYGRTTTAEPGHQAHQ